MIPAFEQNKKLKAAILEVIEQQIRNQDPPETASTLTRLLNQGLSKEKSLELIGYVVGLEVLSVMESGRKFDRNEFAKRLHALPSLPWDMQSA